VVEKKERDGFWSFDGWLRNVSSTWSWVWELKRGGCDPTQRRGEHRGSAEVGEIPTSRFFVSVASTGFRFPVSLLFAALARRTVSVASKGFTDVGCWQEGNWMRADDFEGVRRTARGEGMWAGHQKSVPEQQSHYSRSVPIVK
jgi:hypothetical protein